MGKLLELYKDCQWCKGSGVGTDRDGQGNTVTEDPCNKCGGKGKYKIGYVGGDELDDLFDKLDDILDKCNDILEKVSE